MLALRLSGRRAAPCGRGGSGVGTADGWRRRVAAAAAVRGCGGTPLPLRLAARRRGGGSTAAGRRAVGAAVGETVLRRRAASVAAGCAAADALANACAAVRSAIRFSVNFCRSAALVARVGGGGTLARFGYGSASAAAMFPLNGAVAGSGSFLSMPRQRTHGLDRAGAARDGDTAPDQHGEAGGVREPPSLGGYRRDTRHDHRLCIRSAARASLHLNFRYRSAPEAQGQAR